MSRASNLRARERFAISLLALGLIGAVGSGAPTFSLVGASGILAFSLSRNWAKIPSTLGFYILLVGVTAVPLLVALNDPNDMIVNENPIRRQLFTQSNLMNSLLIVVLQTATLSTFLNLLTEQAIWSHPTPQPHRGKRPWALALATIALAQLANPTSTILLGNYGGIGFGLTGLGGLGGWNLFFVISFGAFAVRTHLRGNLAAFTVAACLAIWLAHGNRGEVLGIGLLLAAYRWRIFPLTIRSAAMGAIGLGLFSTFFYLIKILRTSQLRIDQALVNLPLLLSDQEAGPLAVITDTAGPSAFALLSSVFLVHDGGWDFLGGSSYIDYVYRILPASWSGAQVVDVSIQLRDLTTALGGAHFGGEPFLNFGVIGTVIYAALIGLLLVRLGNSRHKSRLAEIFDISLLLLGPRVAWYGFIYLFKAILIFAALAVINSSIQPRRIAAPPSAHRPRKVGK